MIGLYEFKLEARYGLDGDGRVSREAVLKASGTPPSGPGHVPSWWQIGHGVSGRLIIDPAHRAGQTVMRADGAFLRALPAIVIEDVTDRLDPVLEALCAIGPRLCGDVVMDGRSAELRLSVTLEAFERAGTAKILGGDLALEQQWDAGRLKASWLRRGRNFTYSATSDVDGADFSPINEALETHVGEVEALLELVNRIEAIVR